MNWLTAMYWADDAALCDDGSPDESEGTDESLGSFLTSRGTSVTSQGSSGCHSMPGPTTVRRLFENDSDDSAPCSSSKRSRISVSGECMGIPVTLCY